MGNNYHIGMIGTLFIFGVIAYFIYCHIDYLNNGEYMSVDEAKIITYASIIFEAIIILILVLIFNII